MSGPSIAQNRLKVVVVETGQGLAQIAASNGHALVFDMGTASGFTEWELQYKLLNSPVIDAIVISHSHADHYAALNQLPATLAFSGTIIMSPGEDTALIRTNSGVWQDRITFKLLNQSDTLMALAGVTITCLWPPDTLLSVPFADSLKNRYSMVWKIDYQSTAFLITGDIDSFATAALSSRYGFMLHCNSITVPHHGSSSALDPVFYGYCSPETAIISCGRDNSYGHPSEGVVDLLWGMNVDILRTYSTGSIRLESNGVYLQQY